jgi:hypothetical protein
MRLSKLGGVKIRGWVKPYLEPDVGWMIGRLPSPLIRMEYRGINR